MMILNAGPMTTLGFLQNLGWMEMVIIMALLLLLFGRRLPEVGKSLGKGIVEFKKGIKGIEDEVDQRSAAPMQTQPNYPPPQQLPPPGYGQQQQQYAPQQGYVQQPPTQGPPPAPSQGQWYQQPAGPQGAPMHQAPPPPYGHAPPPPDYPGQPATVSRNDRVE